MSAAAAWSPRSRTSIPAARAAGARRACPCPLPKARRARAGTRPERTPGASVPRPRVRRPGSLHVLDLLAQAFQLFLDDDHRPADLHVVGLGADGIGFTVHLLKQEIQLATRH